MVEVSIASEADLEDIVDLFHRMNSHYFGDQAHQRGEIEGYVRRNLFQPHCGVKVALAKEGRAPLGIATFAILYPAPNLTGQLFLKDLFTIREARKKGVGTAFLHFLAAHALASQCSRLDWTAETANPDALAYYDRLGVPRVREKVYYRLEGEALRSMAIHPLRE